MTLNHRLLNDLELLHLTRAQLEEAAVLATRIAEPATVLAQLREKGYLSSYQIAHLEKGRGKDLCIGPYVIVTKIGEGGMGMVYKAIQRNLGRDVALKVVKAERLSNPRAIKRFYREAKLTAQLNHPNIVGAFDVGEVDKNLYLVMEYVQGNTLAQRIEKKGPMQVAAACEYIRQTATGMQYAHQRGMIHRDIKPQNLMLTKDKSTLKILDLGLARLSGADGDAPHGATQITQDGAIIGSLDFMSPEQAASPHKVDLRADIYSIGCTFYYLLAGRVPFPGGTMMEKIALHRDAFPVPVDAIRPSVPTAVSKIVYRLMAKNPLDRFQTCHELIDAIDQILEPNPNLNQNRPGSTPSLFSSSPSILLPDSTKSKADISVDPVSAVSNYPNSEPMISGDPLVTGSSLPPGSQCLISPSRVTAATKVENESQTMPNGVDTMEVVLVPRKEPEKPREAPAKSRNWALFLGLAGVILGCLNLMRSHDANSRQDPAPNTNEGAVAEKNPDPDHVASTTGNALVLDGKTGHIFVPGWRYDGSHSLTIEAWVTPRKATSTQCVFGDFDQGGMCLCINSSDPNSPHWEFTVFDGQKPQSIVSKSHVIWDQRTHVAVTFGSGTGTLFVDGKRQGEFTGIAPYHQSTMPFLVGACPLPQTKGSDYATKQHFHGVMEEIRINKSICYAVDFKPIDRFSAASETVLLYHLDEAKGDIASDASGNQRHGIVKGGATVRDSTQAR